MLGDRRKQIGTLRLIALTVVAFGVACSSVPSQRALGGANARPAVLSLVAPIKFGAYQLTERLDSGNPADGVTHQYASPMGERWTTYFYRPDPEDFFETSDELLDAQLEAFKEVLEYQRAQGVYDAYEIAVEAPDPIRGNGRTLPGRKLAFVYRKVDATYVSVLFLYVIRGGCVKIRGTVESEVWDRAQPTFPRDFLRALLLQNDPL